MQFRRQQKTPVGRQRNHADGQRSPVAFSYHAQRSERTTNTGREVGRDEAAKHPSLAESVLQRIGLLVLAIVIIIVVISNLILSAAPRLIAIPAGTPYFLHPLDTYKQSIGMILQQSIWNTNKLTINTASVSKKIQEQFPELKSASIALPLLGHRPVVYIEPNQPVFIINAASGSYVLDSGGTAVLATTQLPPNASLSLPIVTDQTGLKLSAGRQVLTSGNVAFIQQVLAQLKARNIPVKALILPPAASELDVYPTGQPYFVKFNMHGSSDDARQQAGTFIAVQKKLASQAVTPDKYIDVRVDGRAYYQ